MLHDTPLISTIVAGLVLAFMFGAIAHRFKMPPLVGYLVAGILVGPYTPGFVANTELASELSEIGVILLMFGVGLHFSLKDLLSVQAVAIPGALLRIAGGTALGLGLAMLMGWSIGAGILFGLALSVASTVVLLKSLQDRHMVDSDRGRIAIGWVIVEDIAMVLALVLIPALAGLMGGTAIASHDPFVNVIQRLFSIELNLVGILAVTIIKLAAFIGFMLVVGRRVIPAILHFTAHTGSRELFRLAVLAVALGVAAGAAYLFGVSLALGAFFAGMILSESELSQRAAQESLPLRDAFSVLFFVSVGMLFDPAILVTRPWELLGTLGIIIIGRSLVGVAVVVALKRPLDSALTIAASMAQIGEFSFILAALGVGLGILPPEGQSLVLAGAIISIMLNPLAFFALDHIRPRLEARIAVAAGPEERLEPVLTATAEPTVAVATPPLPSDGDERTPTHLRDHIVLVGYGRVGTVVAEGLLKSGLPFVLIEDAEGRVQAAHNAGIEVVVGNAASPQALALANVAAARVALIAIPNDFEAGQATEQCRKLNPDIRIIARAHSDEEVDYLMGFGANQVIMGEREIGLGMLGWINGENEHAALIAQTEASLASVAKALKLSPRPEPTPPEPTPPEPTPPESTRIAPTPPDSAAVQPEAVEIPASAETAPVAAPNVVKQPATAPAMPFSPIVPAEPTET